MHPALNNTLAVSLSIPAFAPVIMTTLFMKSTLDLLITCSAVVAQLYGQKLSLIRNFMKSYTPNAINPAVAKPAILSASDFVSGDFNQVGT